MPCTNVDQGAFNVVYVDKWGNTKKNEAAWDYLDTQNIVTVHIFFLPLHFFKAFIDLTLRGLLKLNFRCGDIWKMLKKKKGGFYQGGKGPKMR